MPKNLKSAGAHNSSWRSDSVQILRSDTFMLFFVAAIEKDPSSHTI